jgi:transcription-repair coupling factor (superfamily II helicase)
VLICAESNGRRETLQQYFNEYDRHWRRRRLRRLPYLQRQTDAGRGAAARRLRAVYPGRAPDLHHRDRTVCRLRPPRRQKKQEAVTQVESMVRDLSELKIGDPVVHINHGIGRYMGLTSMDLGEGETEFLHLEYAKDTKLYVPVAAARDLALFRRLAGRCAAALARLRPVGKAKRKAAEQVRDTAAELLNLYARRALRRAMPSNIRRMITSASPTVSASTKRRTSRKPSTT